VGAVYGLWLSLKGKVLADSFVLRGGGVDEFWIGSYHSAGGLIRERLESYVIADDVTIEDQTAAWEGVTRMGQDAAAKMAGRSGAVVFLGRRDRGAALECVFRGGEEPEWLAAWNGPHRDREEMERMRIAAGIPAIPADIGPADLPNEAGLEVDAISYSKGCYLGQEVMARLKSMGQVRRRLVRVQGSAGPAPAVPVPLFVAARQVGELRSAVCDGAGGWVGLALVSKLHVTAATPLAFGADGPGAVHVLEAP
jgi:hypothetical protein